MVPRPAFFRSPRRTRFDMVRTDTRSAFAASATHVRRYRFGSSLSVYGTYAADQVVSEADRAAPEDLYGAAKLYVEQIGEAYRQSYGLEFVSLRIGRVVGGGAQSASSAWRSQIVELLPTRHAAELRCPTWGRKESCWCTLTTWRAKSPLCQGTRPATRVRNVPRSPGQPR